MTGDSINAKKAKELDWVDEVVGVPATGKSNRDQQTKKLLMQHALKKADQYLALDPKAFAINKVHLTSHLQKYLKKAA